MLISPQKWHFYSAYAEALQLSDLVYTVEICMTGLDREAASIFYKSESISAALTTSLSGICNILADSQISDFEFDPCG